MAILAIFVTIKDIESTMWKWILFGLFIILAIIGFIASYLVEIKEQNAAKERGKTMQNQIIDLGKQLTDIFMNRELNTKDIEEIILLRFKEIFNSSEEDAKKFAESLSLPEKLEEMKSLSLKGQELGIKLLLKWKPLYDFVRKNFDDRIYELERKNMIKSFNKDNEQEIVSIERPAKTNTVIRNIIFPNGNQLRVQLFSGEIKSSQLVANPRITIEQITSTHSYPLFYIDFRDSYIQLYLFNPSKSFTTEKDDPLSDEEFRTKVTEAISNSIQLVYLEDIQDK